MTTTDGLQQIVLILSVANVVIPLVFGFLMWKMSQFFVSKKELEDLRISVNFGFAENREWRKSIDADIMELLQRTADRR